MLLDMQRDVAKKHNVIMDGRDIGTVVLPRATVKIFLTASAEVRAQRRTAELQAKGQKADYATILKEIQLRDHQDSTRAITIVNSDETGKVTDIVDYSGMRNGFEDVYIRILVIGRKYLEEIINDAMAHGYTSFTKDILIRNYQRHDCRVYKFDGYFATIRSINDYYSCSMDLLKPEIRHALFSERNRPVLTKVRNSSPASYIEGAIVRNSLIADGCVIEGTVENSILFRGVKVGKNTHIKNSIIMQDTITGENVYLNCVITDKNVVIRDGRVLSGHETRPFFIDKGSCV
jgi:glucose-1-phosphate adenylyltransferase